MFAASIERSKYCSPCRFSAVCGFAGRETLTNFFGLFLYAAAGLLLCLNTLPRPALLGGPAVDRQPIETELA
jgi:hypothetical protein